MASSSFIRLPTGDTASSRASTDQTCAKHFSAIYASNLSAVGLPCSMIKASREVKPLLPALTQAIRESRIWIVILSKKYASSSWCLREMVEILECKEATGQIVMTIFYGADPSDVRQQTGDFGSSFVATCARTTEEERNHVGNIAGEHFLNWDNESEMIEKIARDVSNKLNATTCKDFEDIVGIETKMLKDTDKASNEEEENNVEGKEHAYCWSWFVYCFDFFRIV